MNEPVLLQFDGAVAHLRFNRPERMNAVDVAASNAFLACVRRIADAPEIRAVVVGGEGRAFGVGGDLAALSGDPVAGVPPLLDSMHEALKLMAELSTPFIASLHGVVAGGSLSVAMACDLAVAAEDTKFNLAYVNVGAICDGGASWSLPRLVGLRNALAIALLGETFGAAEALQLGLVNRVVPAASLDAQAVQIARRLAQGPTLAIGRMKRLLRTSFDHTLAEQLDCERDEFVANAGSQDFQAGLAAFVAKRKPVFSGR